ncbi:TIGR04388 family protein, partial [Leptospira licerasiae]|uniref:TIGR04388 family protein n=1 Tax=Leptospira licerasiae TaxID=447106 RepID=UPI003017DA11
VMKPINTIVQKGMSEAIVGATSIVAETVHGVTTVLGNDLTKVALGGVLGNTFISDKSLNNLDDTIRAQGKDAAEYMRGKDLQGDLAKGDLKGQYKQAIKEEIYLQIATAVAPSFGNMDPATLSQLWQEFDRRQAQKEAKREQDQQMLSTAVSMAAATALQFVPGPGTVAGASIMAQLGAYMTSAQGMVVAANAVAQGIIASRHGNMNEVFAGVANGLLITATGPGGLAGSISYTPPQKANSLGDLIDVGMNGTSASGWGGGVVAGASKINGGISFSPGSGIDLNFGGTLGGSGGFFNLSYNTTSGNTNGTIGAGQKYGTNIGINLSTDHNQAPSIFAGFGCDVKGDNCGGGRNALGVGTSLTLNADGTVNLGADFLGNQALGITYDSNTGTWSDVTVEGDWAKNFTYMNAQNVADEIARQSDNKKDEAYSAISSDSNIFNKSENLKALAAALGLAPDALREKLAGAKDDIYSADPETVGEAKKLLADAMKAIHDEAYKGANPNLDLQKAIENSKVIAKVDTGSANGTFMGDLGMQAKIYFNQIVGNAVGEFAYINENGQVVFQSCFVAGTLVHTPTGLKAIETLKIGDVVFAFDEESGQKVIRKVTETFINQTTTILKITDSKGEVIETTWNHPFYVTAGMWVKAKDLIVGDEFLTIDGKEIKVVSIQESIRDEKVYNLEVEDAHTYYVSENGVLVHNYLDNAKPFLDNFKNALTVINQESLKAVSTINEDIKKANDLKKQYAELIENVNITTSEKATYIKEIKKLDATIKSRTEDLNQRAKEIDTAISFKNKSDELVKQTQYTEYLKQQLEGNLNLTSAEKAAVKKALDEQIVKVQKLKNEVQTAFASVSKRFAGEANRFLDSNLKYTGPFAFLNENVAKVDAGGSLLTKSSAFKAENTIVNTFGFNSILKDTKVDIIKDFASEYKGDPSKMPDISKVLDRTYERPNIDYDRMKTDLDYKKAVVKSLTDNLYGSQFGRNGTELQLEVVMGSMKQVYPTKEAFLEKAFVQKDGESDKDYVARQVRMEGIATWMYEGSKTIKVIDQDATVLKRLQSGVSITDPSIVVYKDEVVRKDNNDLASGIAAATCRIYANWMQAVLSEKTNLSFGEFYSSKLMEGDIGMGQQNVAPVLDLGGTPGFDNSYGAPEIGGGAHNFSGLSLSLFGGLLGPNKFTEMLGQFIDMPNPIPMDTLTQKLDQYKEGDVVQIWVDNTNPPGPNHFSLIMKTDEGWVNYNHNGSLGDVGYGKVIEPKDFQKTKIYKIYGPND